jgi:UDP-N-acetylglucosamine--N-acetylmuramyl-(pentapeptide) pyrophosphoryl-undecaprenol N-acetylglucosamine transferase
MKLPATRTARLIFAGGGTGGHLYPAIAIADRVSELLRDRMKVEIIFVGTTRGLEYRIRETLGYPLRIINVRGIARSLDIRNLLVPFVLISALFKARRLVKTFSPHVVVGTGGYVSWPILSMAASQNIITVLQEQNSFPGITTRKLAPRARRIYLGFAKASEYLHTDAEQLVTGNPVRRTISDGRRDEALKAFKLDPQKKTILILGGSQGAHAVNSAVLASLAAGSLPNGFQLLWQTGKRDYTDVVATAGDKAKGHALFPFENRMALVYAAADLAIARAGAITLAELEACAVPSILIPYPFAAGDHQRKNAEEVVKQELAIMVDEKDLAGHDLLRDAVSELTDGHAELMRANLDALRVSKKPAVDIIAEDIIELITAAA